MKTIDKFLGVVFGIALLVALLAGGYFLFRYIAGVFRTLEPQLATVTAIASVVVLICATIIASGLNSHDSETIRVEKAQLYRQLLFRSHRRDSSDREDSFDAEVEHIELKQQLALFGSPKVIAAYAELERGVMHSDGIQLLLNKLVIEMRKDLGLNTYNINQDDLLSLLIEK